MPAASLSGERCGEQPWSGRLAPALLFAALLALFVASFPVRGYGDDSIFVDGIVRGRGASKHFLFLPVARALAWLGAHAGLDPFRVLRLISAAGMAAGGAALFALARRRGARP